MGKEHPVRVAILSDLHFCKISEENKKSHSWLDYRKNGELVSPLWSQLEELVSKESLQADVVICPGDITTRACGDSLTLAWDHLIALKKNLKSPVLAVATGNHDVQSRPINSETGKPSDLDSYSDLTENLKLLAPTYPLISDNVTCRGIRHSNRVHYFGSDFLLYDDDPSYRVMILNTCSRHTSEAKEFERGSIGKAALSWIEEALTSKEVKKNHKVNILVCHHHPIKHGDHDLGQYDEIFNGDELIKLLNRHGHWVIIHGHKHHSRLVYAPGGSRKIPIFSAGTLSAHRDEVGGKDLLNQFYLLEIDKSQGKALRGTVNTWNWYQGDGWIKTHNIEHGICSGVGFGPTSELEDIADKIEKITPDIIGISWGEITERIQDIKYLFPLDIQNLEDLLLEKDIRMEKDNFSGPLCQASCHCFKNHSNRDQGAVMSNKWPVIRTNAKSQF